jgi:predicted transcriptional regulator
LKNPSISRFKVSVSNPTDRIPVCNSSTEEPALLHRRTLILEGIAQGEKAFAEGRTLTHEQAKARMQKWLK